ncbi:MAG: monovalent cation/H(+) antiporter subunit G [Kiloniellales bacterium]|nr:monovalent cation/H(+) antiporter subunit G [Kiloniellales bacterium]
MELLLDILSWLFLALGSAFLVTGGIGILRFPDLYARMHAAGVIDTLGCALLLVGLALQSGLTLVTLKLFLILVFVQFTSPTATYALANAAYRSGLAPLLSSKDDEPSKP